MNCTRLLLTLISCSSVAHAQTAPDALASGFAEPPAETRPLVYWQWVNGNVTHEGIRLDLEWMQRIGLAGALMFDIGFRTPPVPQYVERRVGYGTPEWRESVRVASTEARRLGLLLGAQSSGGWSVSGGPMVAPKDAMKKLVWSETIVTASSSLPVRLPAPPSNSGPFQDISLAADQREPTLYGDVAVIAYRLPASEQKATLRTSVLEDGRYDTTVELQPDAGGNIVLQAQLEAHSFTLAMSGPIPRGAIEASADGVNYTPAFELPPRSVQQAPVITFALGEPSGRHWRVRFTDLKQALRFSEARFDTGAYVHRFQEKAGYGVLVANASDMTDAVRDGNLVLPNGAKYRLLVLPETPARMSLPVVTKLRELAQAGAVIVGPKPIGAEGLAAKDEQVLAIAEEAWKAGRVYSHLSEALRVEKIAPDVVTSNANLHWAHRVTTDADIYFLTNQSGERVHDNVQFRIVGRNVELWNAVDGSRRDAAYTIAEQTTSVSLTLEPYSSQFVVFRGKATATTREPVVVTSSTLMSLDDNWKVAFLDGRGAPEQMHFPALRSWTEDSNPAVRYYSGRVAYERTIDIPRAWLAKHQRMSWISALSARWRESASTTLISAWPGLRRLHATLRAGFAQAATACGSS